MRLLKEARRVLGVVGVLVVVLGVGACVSSAPSPNPTDSVTTSPSRPAVIIEPPKGWHLVYPRSGYEARVLRKSYKKGDKEGISVHLLSVEYFQKYSGLVGFDETGKIDPEVYRDAWMSREAVPMRGYSEVVSLGNFSLDGVLAAGASYKREGDSGEMYSCQRWVAWRAEGLWDFFICSEPGGSDIDPDLLAAFHAAKWADVRPTFYESPSW